MGVGLGHAPVDVVGLDPLEVEHTAQGLEVRAALDAAGDDPERASVGAGQVFRGYRRGRPRAGGRDPGAVHDGQRHTRGGVVQDEEAVDVGQAPALVPWVA